MLQKQCQDKLARQGTQSAKAIRWADRQPMGGPPGRRDPKTVQKRLVKILRSIQQNMYKEFPEDWNSHPEEETTTTDTSGSGTEVGEVRPWAPSRLFQAPVTLCRPQLHSWAGAVVGYAKRYRPGHRVPVGALCLSGVRTFSRSRPR